MIATTMTPADVAELAEILVEDIKAYVDRVAEAAVYSGRELRIMRWMLATAQVRYTDDMVMIRIARKGMYDSTAYSVAAHLFDGLIMENREDGLGAPFSAGGEIIEVDANTWAVKY